ncbi:Intraflagellar transport protein 140 [Clonorchis sinensis]|uniref:Intraflagellar transport protein 140 n=1 Tax=Clonorchis sinensis TaxID=79923 RepID=A0A8T1M3X3_CLOSI|nr:Intraflagellar transport protein 140 [Clonorchis sinensis]
MAVFISSKLGFLCNEVSLMQWHKSYPLLAVAMHGATESGEVAIFNTKEHETDSMFVSRPFRMTALSWHPLRKLVAAGLSSGSILFIDVMGKCVVDVKSSSDSKIVAVAWSNKGSKLLSADINGFICVWRQNSLGDMQQMPLFTLNINSVITQVSLLHIYMTEHKEMDISSLAKAAVKGDEKALDLLSSVRASELSPVHFDQYESSAFLIGCEDGRLLRVSGEAASASVTAETGMNRLITLASCDGSILNMTCHPRNGSLIVITDKGMLFHYLLAPPNGATVREITKVKLAVTLTGTLSLTWAAGSVLAMATGEPFVRLWDVEQADNYTLAPNVTDHEEPNKSIKVLQVAYSSMHQILVAGLSNGMVAFWQYGKDIVAYRDLPKLLQSDPTWSGDHSSFTDAWSVSQDEEALTSKGYALHPNSQERGPEADWHPQPTAILVNRSEAEFTAGAAEFSWHVQALVWDGDEERLAVALSTQHSPDHSSFAQVLQSKCTTYLLERQTLCSGFGQQGCAVVQTGPRSLALFTSTTHNSTTAPVIKSSTDSGGREDQVNPLSVPQPINGLPAAFIATSTAFVSGSQQSTNYRGCSAFKDESALIGFVREHEAQVEDQIRALYCTHEYVSYWNGHRISTFRHATGDCILHFGSFSCEFRLVGMYDETLFTIEPYKLQTRTFQGTVKQLINFSETDGSVVQTAQCANLMLCLTDQNKAKIYDVSRREVKLLNSTNSLTELVLSTALTKPCGNNKERQTMAGTSSKDLRILCIALNQSGNAISFTLELPGGGCVVQARWPTGLEEEDINVNSKQKLHQKTVNELKQKKLRENNKQQTDGQCWVPDTRIYVYHLDKDKLQYFDFCASSVDTTWFTRAAKSNVTIGRWPKHHFWDQYDPRLLAIEAVPLSTKHPAYKNSPSCAEVENRVLTASSRASYANKGKDTPESCAPGDSSRPSSKLTYSSTGGQVADPKLPTLIVSMFTGPDQTNPVVQEHFPMALQHSSLLALEVPYYYFAVRCDLVYRLVTEQSQRRRNQVTSGRRFVGEVDENATSPILDLNESQPEATTSADPNGPATLDMTSTVDTNNSASIKIHYINRRVMRDFIDLEQTDSNTRDAMLSFSYYLTMGEMDAAFKAMKLIKSPAVWQNMARMCVSTCRLDVARVCLGKTENAMAALMVREAREREPELEAQAGELALQLGMPDEAERLFAQCNRWDLVIRLHQSLGQWEKALRVAAAHNRISLRATHYAYAKELESTGRLQEAIEHYIQSETHRFEVPRMLKSTPDMLETFVNQQKDKIVLRWWAQTLEAEGQLDEARNYYLQAKDYLSLVRVLCCLGQSVEAEALCNETGDPAACYHLARQMEASGNVDQAVRLFTRAKAYSSAVRLCKEHDRNDHLYSLAQLGRPEDMLEAAKHLESKQAFASKAVLLYHRAGYVSRAVELAFQTHQFAALQSVAGSLDDRIDPVLLRRCAEFFVQNNQFDRAVDVLAAGKQYWDALKLCAEYNVSVTEELVEKMTPTQLNPDDQQEGSVSGSERTSILIELGELCLGQGQYHLACKKFTQAGSRIAAMKALIRSGDTEKIIFFANVSKQKEIYVMAANYLQTLEGWRTNVDTMRTIVQFYTRGRAPESLAFFYEACAHAEIEDFGSYEKATGALTEAYKVLIKAVNSPITNEASELRLQKRLTLIKNKAAMCKQFAETQLLFSVDPLEAMRNCQSLLENIEPGDIVRPGDVYAAMIREFVAKEKYQAALSCMHEMRERLSGSIQSVLQYLDRDTVDRLQKALNLPILSEPCDSECRSSGKDGADRTDDSPAFDDNIMEASLSDASDGQY